MRSSGSIYSVEWVRQEVPCFRTHCGIRRSWSHDCTFMCMDVQPRPPLIYARALSIELDVEDAVGSSKKKLTVGGFVIHVRAATVMLGWSHCL